MVAQAADARVRSGGGSGAMESAYRRGNRRAAEDAYCTTSNPLGIIGLGLAENGVAYGAGGWGDAIGASTLRLAESGALVAARARYPSWQGLPGLRQGLARLMARVGVTGPDGAGPEPDDLVVFCGATSAIEAVALALCAPGDGVLIPAPYYASFDVDLGLRAQCVPVPVPSGPDRGWRAPGADALNAAYAEATRRTGRPPPVLLICSPNNPTGLQYTAAELDALCVWAVGRGMHVVSDEVYAGTEEADGPGGLGRFTSAAAVQGTAAREAIHVVYGMSKVAGIPGMRAACVWSRNAGVREALSAAARFASLPTDAQLVLADVLGDDSTVAGLVAASRQALCARRRDALDAIRGFLEGRGVPCVPADSGIFLWARLADGHDSELALFEDLLSESKVCITPGHAFHSPEPGWFRICFAAGDDEETRLGLTRLGGALCAR